MNRKHVFILNPVAGKRCCVDFMTEKIHKAFENFKEEYEILITGGPGDAKKMTNNAADYDGEVRVYACGGDGTLNGVINGAAGHENMSVCPVPVGSGNDFIKYFDDIPTENFLDVDKCIRAESVPCDLMRVGDKYSVNIISVGLDAVTGRRQAIFKKWPFISGKFAYKIALLCSAFTSMKNKIKLVVDGKEFDVGSENITLGVVGNGKWYGGGFKAAPYSVINDSLIDLVAVKAVSLFTFIKYASDYKNGRHIEKMPYVSYTRCKKIKMLSDKPITIQFDGEVLDIMNPEVEIVPNATRIIIPGAKVLSGAEA